MIKEDFNPGLQHRFFFIRTILLKAIRKYALQFNGQLLDFGCGSKPYRNLFKVEKYIGLDFPNPGHDHTKEQIDVLYNGGIIPFDNEVFDGVLATEVVEHVFDLDFTLSEFNRVLKYGGKVLITCPFVWMEHEKPYDFARYTEFALTDRLESNGFKVINFEKGGNFAKAIAQLRALYLFQWGEPIFKKGGRMGYYCLSLFTGIINIRGLLNSWIFPKNNELYLSNIILAEKVRESKFIKKV